MMNLYILLAVSFLISSIRAQLDCFAQNYLTYGYPISVNNDNYTQANEYWIKRNTTCTFLVSVNNMVGAYSSSVSFQYQMYVDKGDGSGCRANTTTPLPY